MKILILLVVYMLAVPVLFLIGVCAIPLFLLCRYVGLSSEYLEFVGRVGEATKKRIKRIIEGNNIHQVAEIKGGKESP